MMKPTKMKVTNEISNFFSCLSFFIGPSNLLKCLFKNFWWDLNTVWFKCVSIARAWQQEEIENVVYKFVFGPINQSRPLFQQQASWEESGEKIGAELEVAGSMFSSASRKFSSPWILANYWHTYRYTHTHIRCPPHIYYLWKTSYLGCSANFNKQFVPMSILPVG